MTFLLHSLSLFLKVRRGGLSIYFLQIGIQGGGDAGVLLGGGLEFEFQSRFLDSLGCGGTKRSDGYFVFLDVRDVFDERVQPTGTEKNDHVVVERLVRGEGIGYGSIHDSFLVDNLFAFQNLSKFVVVDVAQGYEIFIVLVLDDLGNDVIDLSCGTKEHFTLAILDVFLDIECNGFSNAEIFHVIRNVDAQLFAKLEEIVDGMTRSEHHSSIIQNGYVLLTEFLGRQSLNFNERMEIYLDAASTSYLIVR